MHRQFVTLLIVPLSQARANTSTLNVCNVMTTKSFPLYASQQDPGGPNSSRSGEQNQLVEYPGVRSPEKHRLSSEPPLIVLKGSPSSLESAHSDT